MDVDSQTMESVIKRLRRVTAPAEDEMAYPDLPTAHGAETDVKASAVGARGPDVHGMPPRADVTTRTPLVLCRAFARSVRWCSCSRLLPN